MRHASKLVARGVLALALAAALAPASSAAKIDWIAGQGVFHTTEPSPAGAEVRIRVQKPGKDTLELLSWTGKKKKARRLQSWRGEDLRAEQVLRFRLPERSRIALRVQGAKRRPPKGQSPHEGFRRLRFGGGWVVDVKVVDDTF